MSINKKPYSRFAFYWKEQRGRCGLMITDACRMHGGQMTTDNGKRRSHATWDHIYPKPRTAEQEPIQVLACAACNNRRGNAPARAEYIARGLVLFDEWRRFDIAQAKEAAVRRAQRKTIAKDPLAQAVKAKRAFCLIGSRAHRAALERGAKPDTIITEKAQGILDVLKPMERK